jgi:serine/threonine protein kinase/Flp pilus assembly protein TadD
MIGQQIGQFKITEKLGQGGMGEVYLAEDTKLHRKVALKLLPAHFAQDRDFKSRFEHEATAAAALNHPNIITVYDRGEHEGRPFIVMEYVAGQGLDQLIAAGNIPIEKAVDVILQVSEGLGAAHEAGIVHRDIKPGNIFIDKTGRARVLDFGLAKSRRATADTQVGTTVGTIQYESPEQGRGEEVDPRSDLFSVGVLLYEMVAGRLPFGGEFTDAIRYAIAHENPEPLARFKTDVPDDLQRIVSKLLEKDPDLRYQSASGLVSDLKLLQRASGSHASAVHSAVHPVPKRKRGRLLSILVPTTLAAVALVVVLVVKPWQLEFRSDQPAVAAQNRIAVMYFDNLSDPGDSLRLGEIAANLLITDLSNQSQVQVVSSQRLYDLLKQLGHGDIKKIDRGMATQVAEKAEARWMLMGSILRTEPNILLTAQLVETASGDNVSSQRIDGEPGEDIFAIVDRLSDEIRGGLQLTEASSAESDRSIADVTTHSTEAYRYYLDGIEWRDKLYIREAVQAFKKALELDSTFVMAYVELAVLGAGSDEELDLWIARAKAHADRVSPVERLWIQIAEARRDEDDARGIEIIHQILALDPFEKDALLGLAQTYRQRRQTDSAIHYLNRLVECDPSYKFAYNLLAYAYDQVGEFEKSIAAINKYLELAPDEANPYDSRGDLYAYNGKYEEAIESYRQALQVKPDYDASQRKLGHMYLLLQDYTRAESCFTVLSSDTRKGVRSQGRMYLASVPAYRGQFTRSLEVLADAKAGDRLEGYMGQAAFRKSLARALTLVEVKDFAAARQEIRDVIQLLAEIGAPNSDDFTLILAWIDAQDGKAAAARAVLDSVRATIPDTDSARLANHCGLAAYVELAAGNAKASVALIERSLGASGLTPDAVSHYFAGQAYLQAGDLGEAIDHLERLITRYDEGVMTTPWYIAKGHYYLGLAYERSGWAKKAAAQFELFLEIWQDADPGIPEVEDAKQRLASLQT